MMRYIANTIIVLLATLLPIVSVATEAVERDLGVRNASLSAAGQAKEMLSLINDKPHELKYQIHYKTEVDSVVFECDIAMDTLTLVHKRRNGAGTAEKWQGDVLYRLQAATKGGSLNDTASGRSMGKLTSF